MDSSVDYYEILGVLPNAEDIVIRAAYRALSLRYHPDQWKGDRGIGEKVMRQLNAAYEILSDPARRKQYDQIRNQGSYQQYQPDGTDAEFTDQERTQAEAWKIALEYYPDLDNIFNTLKITSSRLAVSFRVALLETKHFNIRLQLAKELEKQFLQSYFGSNDEIVQFARDLIKNGDRKAAKELNKAVSVLGSSDPKAIIDRIRSKYAQRAKPEELESIARRVISHRFVQDAEKLIHELGGEVTTVDQTFWMFREPKIRVDCLQFSVVLDGPFKMVEWVATHLVPKVLRQ